MQKMLPIFFGLVVTFFLMASGAQARGMGWGIGAHLPYGYPAITNLTPEQASKIQELQRAYLNEITPLQQELLKKRIELKTLWVSTNPNASLIQAKEKEIFNLQAKLTDKATNLKLEIRKLLTPEQQAQLAAYRYGVGPKMGRIGRRIGW